MDTSLNALPFNRSVPPSTVIPVLCYKDVTEAAAWLCKVFGFTERLRIGNHRIQLNVGDRAIVVAELPADPQPALWDEQGILQSHSLLIRVKDANRHYEYAKQNGAAILQPPADHPYGERQYSVKDPGGHKWTFSESIMDVAPEDWGGEMINSNSSAAV